MNGIAVILTLAGIATIALVALAMLGVRVAAFPPAGVYVTTAQRIELYAASVALLTLLGQTWIVHPGIPSGTRVDGTVAAARASAIHGMTPVRGHAMEDPR